MLRFSRIDLEKNTQAEIFQRGVEYYHEGHLLSACQTESVLAGSLAGTGARYKTRLWLESDGLHGDCTCLYNGFCKHMIALGVAWLEQPDSFTDLSSKISQILSQPAALEGYFKKLVLKDPLNFLAILSDEQVDNDFLSSRGRLNLLRNVFKRSYFSIDQAQDFWEHSRQLTNLIFERCKAGDGEALASFNELLVIISQEYLKSPEPMMKEYFGSVLADLKEIACQEEYTELSQTIDTLFQLYFQPELWEFHQIFRETLQSLLVRNPQPELTRFSTIDLINETDLTLFCWYELFYYLAKDNPEYGQAMLALEKALCRDSEGLFLLADFLMEIEPERALTMVRTGLRLAGEGEKGFYRERLIKFHIKNREMKQAAALSFIQFTQQPTFEGYQQLKIILADYPREFDGYLNRIKQILRSQGDDLLLFKIALANGDQAAINAHLTKWNQYRPDRALINSLVAFLTGDLQFGLARFYPDIIFYLMEQGSKFRHQAIELSVIFKKNCLQYNYQLEWDQFREEFLLKYPDFEKEFGTLFTGGMHNRPAVAEKTNPQR